MFELQYSYTKEKFSARLHPIQLAQIAPKGTILDPVLEKFPLAELFIGAPPAPFHSNTTT